MSSKGGYSAPPPSHGGDRFYNAPAVRRQQQIFLQQQQVMQMQLFHQQQLEWQQRQMQRRAVSGKAESSSGAVAVESEKRGQNDDSSKAVPFSIPPSVATPAPNLKLTNLDRLMESVTPFISVQFPSEANGTERRTREVDAHPFFCLEALWESFNEWSAYGVGVPLLLNGKDQIEQYYVPFLSGMQLYADLSKASSQLNYSDSDRDAKSVMNVNMQRLDKLSLGDNSSMNSESEVANFPALPLFQFLEYEPPYNRRPLADKISVLISQHPELSKSRSCDLLPTSWICVAWYPIYRIPVGPTLQDLDASFLTFHSLSTQSKRSFPPQFHAPKSRKVNGVVDPTAKISLPVFALASYKLKGSILSPCGPEECEQENSLLKAADEWLTQLKVKLPDYQFFHSHYSHWR